MARKALRGSDFGSTVEDHMRQMVPDVVRQHPRLVSTLSALAVTTAAGLYMYISYAYVCNPYTDPHVCIYTHRMPYMLCRCPVVREPHT